MAEQITSISKKPMALLAHEDKLNHQMFSPSARRDRVSTVKGIANFLWQATRWGTLRGGWFLDHLRDHRPFDEKACPADRPIEIMVCIVDHFEPGDHQGDEAAATRVASWCRITAGRSESPGCRWWSPHHVVLFRLIPQSGCCAFATKKPSWFGRLSLLHHEHDTYETFAAGRKPG